MTTGSAGYTGLTSEYQRRPAQDNRLCAGWRTLGWLARVR
jgi:hypothetical protein